MATRLTELSCKPITCPCLSMTMVENRDAVGIHDVVRRADGGLTSEARLDDLLRATHHFSRLFDSRGCIRGGRAGVRWGIF